jgi:glutamate/tyrosine decarboxylase-like PLP-dependent enzyme
MLMTEAFSKNFIDYEEYPRSAEIQNRCVSMIARLFNARECLLPQDTRDFSPSESAIKS